MTGIQKAKSLTLEQCLELLELMKAVSTASSFQELANRVFPDIASNMKSDSAFLYIVDPRCLEPIFLPSGPRLNLIESAASLWADYCDRVLKSVDLQPISVLPSEEKEALAGYKLDLYRLPPGENKCVGMLALVREARAVTSESTWLGKLLPVVASTVDRLAETEKQQRQIAHMHTYITVSSMLAQSLGLRELIESSLDCCKEIASADEASILFLDDEKKNLFFYELEGSSKTLLIGSSFPADKGIAGSVIQSLRSEIVNDVQNDPRFYGNIDSQAKFRTKNMVVVPLVAGEETIGVLSVLNKVNGGDFTEEEHLSLKLIAEEIAFAIRNAKIFEYVVNSYCKQRQGQQSCRGCKRPLGSWTPCVKYRDTEGL